MNIKVKLAAYAVLILLVTGFGWGFHVSYTTVARESAAAAAARDNDAGETPNPSATSNAADQTNLVNSNSVAGETNEAQARTNAAAVPPVAPPSAHSAQGSSIGYLAAFIASLIGLGVLVAYDVTQFFGNVAVDALLDVGDETSRDPDYEKAEQVWAKGDFLEAIQLLRDFLKKNPRAQYAALRIAEIYEKDLDNNLAAALEYEEVLKHKLPTERWGWAAVHLCNLYSKLGQQEKTMQLLRRIADEYPKTAAAKKARSRLGIAEPEPEPIAKPDTPASDEPGEGVTTAEEEAPPAPEPVVEPPPKSNLPPGFRKK